MEAHAPHSHARADSLAGASEGGIPERYVPDEMRGELVEAEHVTRYAWASGFAAGRSVLDAGCGTAYGSAMLAAAGARSVVGVDVAEPMLEQVRDRMPDGVRLEHGDLRELAFADAAFELVVCFEVLEHLADPRQVLDELVRVLAPGGLLVVSSPNRLASAEVNPHHLHEFTPDELERELSERLPHVRLARQQALLASAILPDDAHVADGALPAGTTIHKLHREELGREAYTLAIASDAALPDVEPLVSITTPLELRRWLELWNGQQRFIEEQAQMIRDLGTRVANDNDAMARLVEAEQQLAAMRELDVRVADAERELARSRRTIEDLTHSPSWRITAPLRAAKRLLRRGR
jgi:2-polyprenyl-3-methyl-5-hydroxy-6-metoxy-1,4-benzoquinol methylase